MGPSMAMGVMKEAIVLIIMIAGVVILPGFAVTLLISIFQATTQIQEQTLTFIPKLVITLLIVMFAGGFILNKLGGLFLGFLQLVNTL